MDCRGKPGNDGGRRPNSRNFPPPCGDHHGREVMWTRINSARGGGAVELPRAGTADDDGRDAMRITAAFTTASLIAGATLAAATIVNSNTSARAQTPARAASDSDIEQVVRRHVQPMLIPAGGMAVALSIDGRTLFFNYGMADVARKTPITSDSLFNLASVGKAFIATLLADAVKRGEVSLDDPVAKYVTELQQGGDIRKVTLGQLATHTSGLLLPQDHPPWPDWGYTLLEFIRTLNDWKADKPPGSQHLYTHAGYVLLQLALERRYGTPIDELIERRILQPLGMTSTMLPRDDDGPRGQLSRRHLAVQGYADDGTTVGEPGSQESYYHWPGTGKMYSSPRDMGVFLAANLGELPIERSLREAMVLAQQGIVPIGRRNEQALAWEVSFGDEPII